MENSDFITNLLEMLPESVRSLGATVVLGVMAWIGIARYKKDPAPADVARKAVEVSPATPVIRCGIDKVGIDAMLLATSEIHAMGKRMEARLSDMDASLRDNARAVERMESELDVIRSRLPRRD